MRRAAVRNRSASSACASAPSSSAAPSRSTAGVAKAQWCRCRCPSERTHEMRVLCVDDHAIFRQGVKQILLQHDRQMKIGEAASAQKALEMVREARWDVVILDLSLPDRSGLQLLTELKREQPDLPVLILSMHADDEYAIRSLRSGASAYVTKGGAPEELVTALEKVISGGRYITPALA